MYCVPSELLRPLRVESDDQSNCKLVNTILSPIACFCFSFPPRLCHNLYMATETRDIQKHVLPNGLVVITEPMPHVRSVSVGVWVRNGSRREIPEENGLAHFMEHMVFKGTERRSAEAIAREMDSVGGMLDAFTSKEQICFNAKILDEHLPIAFDVIADLVLRPKFDSEDVKKERQVVLEEIKMDLDNPEYLLHEIFTPASGRSIRSAARFWAPRKP